MKHTLSRAALAAALILGGAASASAQVSPPAPPAPAAPAVPPAPGAAPAAPAPGMPDLRDLPAQIETRIRMQFGPGSAVGSLERAYRTIGEAEAVNGRSPFVGQARGHYTGAYARYKRGDTAGAAAEAMAADALAQAAIDERPPASPRGLEAPPTPAPRPSRPPRSDGAPAPGGLPEIARLPGMFGMPGMPGLDPGSLTRLVTLENTAEVRALADRAGAASANAQRALASNDRDEARRQERLARDLTLAVHGLAAADHPDQVPFGLGGMPRRPLGGPGGPGGGSGGPPHR